MALRWGLTAGAYTKYAFIFKYDLPATIKLPGSSISQACYIRDAIRFAHENGLKGGEWFGQVKVTPVDEGVQISYKSVAATQITEMYPTHSSFELISLAPTITDGYTCYISKEDQEELPNLASSLKLTYQHLGNNLFTLSKEEEPSL